MTDIRQQLLAAFDAEYKEHLAAIRQSLAGSNHAGVDLRDIFRRAHSLKGAARAVDMPDIARLAHALEALLAAVEDGNRTLDAQTVGEIHRGLDAIEDAAAATLSQPARHRGDQPSHGDSAPAQPEAPPAQTPVAPSVPAPAATPAGAGAAASASGAGLLRIAGEHVEQLSQSLHALNTELQSGIAVAEGLRQLEGDLRALRADVALGTTDNEALADRIGLALRELGSVRRAASQSDWAISQAAGQIERDAERILLVAAQSVFEGFERMVRDDARDQGKVARLTMTGGTTEADRRVLQALKDPVMHLLRNAIGHGVEQPDARLRAGKPEQADIEMAISPERGQLTIRISDDGRGYDFTAIEAEARRIGLIRPMEPPPTRDELLTMILEPGFSTAIAVDEISGRGVGLSVVAETVRRLQGSIRMEPRLPHGASVTIRVPLTITRQMILLVEAGGQTFGLPARSIDKLLRLTPEEIARSEGGQVTMIVDDDGGEEAVNLVSLASALGLGATEGPSTLVNGVLIAAGSRRYVLVVDALMDVRGLIIGDPGAIATDTGLFYGTVTVEDERIAIVLHPDALMDRVARDHRRLTMTQEDFAAAGPAAGRRQPTILVVDDSITTRTLEKSILEAQGYRVLLSIDGLDALQTLRNDAILIDLVVADVEMPRMDGFALLQAMRNEPALAGIPVVMMTSRDNADDVRRGLDLGANAYITKQNFDQGALLTTISQLI